jgi:hypothetical protein
MYIILRFSVWPLTYLKVRLRNHAKTHPKTCHNFIFWRYAYPFWWCLLATSLFQEVKITQAITTRSTFSSTKQSIHYCRRNAIIDLSNITVIRTDRNVPPITAQWRISISNRITCISKPNNSAALSFTNGAVCITKTQNTSRSITSQYDREARTSNKNHFRPGLYCSRFLRKTGDGLYRLQPKKEREAILPSTTMFQWHYQGLLAWRIPSWKGVYLNRNYRSFEVGLYQNSTFCKTCFYTRRQRVFRSQDHRMYGVKEGPLCYSCTTHESHKKKTLRFILSSISIRYRDLRVHVSTLQLEKKIPLYHHTSPHNRRTDRTTYSFLNGQVQLSTHRDQYKTQAIIPLEILQWPSICRIDYKRTQSRLSLGENSYKTLRSQRSLFPYSPVFVQPHQLVQTFVSAERISEYDA